MSEVANSILKSSNARSAHSLALRARESPASGQQCRLTPRTSCAGASRGPTGPAEVPDWHPRASSHGSVGVSMERG
eukprot:8412125-Alexandrium_andersonii.AAC.1